MNIRLLSTLLAFATFLVGCATPPQQPVALKKEAIGTQAGRIGVAMATLPKVDTHLPGANCLLCIAAASMANSSLTAHAKSLPYEDLPKLKEEMANALRKKGSNVVVIEGELDVDALPDRGSKEQNFARKDFSSLRAKHNIDKLMVVEIKSLGFLRTYSSYIPTSDPKATLAGSGYMVDLTTHAYDWYKQVYVAKSADQAWDEPPKFPGLTNAYFQALELGKDSFLEPITSSALAAVKPEAASTSTVATNATQPATVTK